MRKLTKSRPLFFARRLAADSPRARTAAPRRRGRPRGRERAQCRDGGGRPSFARQRAAGWELGRREGRKEKRERKERRSLALLLLLRRRRRRRPTGKTIINHIGFDRRRERAREALAAPGVAACSQHGGTRRPTDRRPRWQQSCAARRSFRASLLRGRTYVLLRVRCRRVERSKRALNLRNRIEGEFTYPKVF